MKIVYKLFPLTLAFSLYSHADAAGSTPLTVEAISEKNTQGELQPISAVHGVDKGFFINGSFLYWKADMDNLDYAIKTNVNSTGTTVQAGARVKELDFEWSPGGQLEIGYIFNQREGWKASLSGTHLNTHAHGSARVADADTEQLFPRWTPPFGGQFLTDASAHWELEFNTLDLTLGRDFFVSKWVSFSPYFGLQGAWIEQEYKVDYDAFYVEQAGNFARDNRLKFHHHFKGYGLELGSGFIFHIVNNFGIVGNVEGSLIWGFCDTSQRINGGLPIDGIGFIDEEIHIVNKKHRLRTSFSAELGFIWEMFWNNNRDRFFLSTTYAYSVWFNQNEFKNLFFASNSVNTNPPLTNNFPILEREQGDLQLQGLVVRAGFDF